MEQLFYRVCTISFHVQNHHNGFVNAIFDV